MAKSGSAVQSFLSELEQKLKPILDADLDALKQLKAAREGGGDMQILESDRVFYMKLVEETKYGVNHAAIKEYFPLDTVTFGLLDIFQELLGLKFERELTMEGSAAWHEDVKAYRVLDKSSGDLTGFFYLDMHPREGKADCEQCIAVQNGCMLNTKWQLPVAAVLCQLTKPTAEQPRPLLSHSEVESFFHEFGHAMHHICSKAEIDIFSGMMVEGDFLEAPSQMLENWAYQPAVLRRISSHYETGAPIPDDLLTALTESRKANAGIWTTYEVARSVFDQVRGTFLSLLPKPHPDSSPLLLRQAIHTMPSADTAAIYNRIWPETLGILATPGTNQSCRFAHMGDPWYTGMFYSYLWAEVYSADMFASRFEKEGIFNPVTGASYRKEILAPGGSRDGMDSLKAFLGREPSVDPFLKMKGLLAEPTESSSVKEDKKKEAVHRQQLGELSNSVGNA